MGNLATPEALLHRWAEMQRDPSLQELAYKPHGATITECPVLTDIGIRVPDLAWASAQFMRQHAGMSPLPKGYP